MVEEIKLLMGDASSNFSDAQIGLMAKLALDFVETYTDRNANYSLTLLAERIAVIYLNRMNTEGLTSTSFSGSSESFLDGLHDDIIRELDKKRKVRVI